MKVLNRKHMSSQSVRQIRGADRQAQLHKPKCSRKEECFCQAKVNVKEQSVRPRQYGVSL